MSELLPLYARNISVSRRAKRLIGPIDFQLEGQGTTILLGPNGAGKTTFLKALHGLSRLKTGVLEFACPLDEAQRQQGFVFQSPIVLRRSVRENIAYPLRLIKTPTDEINKRVTLWADKLGLSDALERDAGVLSGGEKQKLALARAMVKSPKLLFLDEPCASLDGRATHDIEAILTEVSASGTRIVMSTHDLGQARRLANEVVFMLHGRLHETATAAAFFEAPKTKEARAFINGDILL